jgi:hypothetical protein
VVRTIQIVITHFHAVLIVPCEIFLGMWCKVLDGDVVTWMVILVLEAFRALLAGELARYVQITVYH